MGLSTCYWQCGNAGSNRVDVTAQAPYGVELALLAYGYRALVTADWSYLPNFQLRDGKIYAYATDNELAIPNWPTAEKLDTALTMCTNHHITSDILTFTARPYLANPPYWLITPDVANEAELTPAEAGATMLALSQLRQYWTFVADPPLLEFEECILLPEMCGFAMIGDAAAMAIIGIDGYYIDEGTAQTKAQDLQTSWDANLPGA